jgi:hypothetical protein
MAYKVEGNYFENCSCEVACPCGASNLALPATYERCDVLMAFHIDNGEVDGVDVSGKTVAVFADTPAQMIEGNWRVGLVIEEDTSEEQRKALASVFSGEQGGPPEIIGGLLGEMLGVEFAPITYNDDGRKHSVTIGEVVDLEVEDFAAAAEGEIMKLDGLAHPANTVLGLAQATRSKISVFGFDLDLTGRNAHSAPFSWAG